MGFAEGLSRIFDYELGTREGGVESLLLYKLIVCDLVDE
jgi:hypothetical protein